MSDHAAPDPLSELSGAGWLLIAAGAISIVAGLLAIAYPDITLKLLAIFGGINLIMMSVLSLVDAFSRHADSGSRSLSAVLGVLSLIAGLLLLRRPGETLLVLLLIFGIWLVVSGAVQFFRSFGELEGRAIRMLAALCEIVLGVVILSLPEPSLRTVAVIAGIAFVLRGAIAVYAGWQLRRAGAALAGTTAGPAPAA
jgi:uncharacterized membrane protein HdeD (DUF308 family)